MPPSHRAWWFFLVLLCFFSLFFCRTLFYDRFEWKRRHRVTIHFTWMLFHFWLISNALNTHIEIRFGYRERFSIGRRSCLSDRDTFHVLCMRLFIARCFTCACVCVCVSVFRCRFKWLSEPIVIIKYVSPFIDLSKLRCKRANEFCFFVCFFFLFISLSFSFYVIFALKFDICLISDCLVGYSIPSEHLKLFVFRVCFLFSMFRLSIYLSPFCDSSKMGKRKKRNKINYKSQLCMKITSILSTAICFFFIVMLFS